MQAAVFAAEVKQRIPARIESGPQHFADEDDMVAAIVHLVAAALEVRERVRQDRRVMPAALPRRLAEAVFTWHRKQAGSGLLADMQNIDSKMTGRFEGLEAA